MKAASLAQIKKELKLRSSQDIEELCLRLGRFKKENKELLTYLLFEADDEQGYITHIKETIDDEFNSITNTNFYYLKKSVRKILKNVISGEKITWDTGISFTKRGVTLLTTKLN